MPLRVYGENNGRLNNLSLSDATGTILDNKNTTFFGADQWYLNTNHTSDGVMTAWTRVPATDGGGNIGSAMSVASGIWTFPTTGIWLVIGNFTINATATDNDNVAVLWEFTDDGDFTTQFTNRAYAQTYVEDEGHTATRNTLFIFDCQDTSTHVLRIKASSLSGSNYFPGVSSSLLYNLVSFIRLGDT